MKQLKTDITACKSMLTQYCMPEWFPAIAANRQWLQYKKGEQVFTEGENVTGMYFVQEGVVKVHKKWDDEKELIIRFAKPGDIVGHRGLGVDNIYPVSGTAVDTVIVCYFDMAFFEATLKVNQLFLYELMMFFAAELKVSERKMRNLAHMSVKARIAHTFLNLYHQFGLNKDGVIDIQLPRQDIAAYAGTTYETVFRIINEMTTQKLVEVNGKNIRLLDIDGLERIIQSPVA